MINQPGDTAELCPSAPITTMWMERGFSRREIAARMLRAVPGLVLYSTPEQPVDNTQIAEYAPLDSPEGIEAFNKQAEQLGVTEFWPQKSATFDLDAIDCAVHAAATPNVITLVDDKVLFSQWLDSDPMRADAIELTGVENIANEYTKRHAEGRAVCVKPVIGVNGKGYWRLTDNPESSLLNDPDAREIHPEVYFAALALEEQNRPPTRMIVMDYLPGPEVSVDLLCWRGQPLIHAARTKLNPVEQLIQSEHVVLEHVHTTAARLAMHGIVSMQYRLDYHGNWKMLEINPRPAGGSTRSEDAGFGIISDWTRLVTHQISPNDVRQRHAEVLQTTKQA
jgi:hypothetical protein